MLKELKIFKSHGRQYVINLRTVKIAEAFRGRPEIKADITVPEINALSRMCPVSAIDKSSGAIDLGKCVFCGECAFAFPGKIKFTNDYRIAANRREDLVLKPGQADGIRLNEDAIRKEVRDMFSGSLKLRQVSAGGDNSCEMELNACGNVNFDMGRYGIEFVASPRHADGIVITGPVTSNMAAALEMTYDAVPEPKIIIVAGTDAISGGIFEKSPGVNRSFFENRKIDLFVPGNPFHPLTFINGVLDLLGIK